MLSVSPGVLKPSARGPPRHRGIYSFFVHDLVDTGDLLQCALLSYPPPNLCHRWWRDDRKHGRRC